MTDPTLDWCLSHDTYRDACLLRHDLPNRADLPDPWPPAGPDERTCPECDGVEPFGDAVTGYGKCEPCDGTGTVTA